MAFAGSRASRKTPPRPVLLALAHPAEAGHGLAEPALGLLPPAAVRGHRGEAGIGPPEVRVQIDGAEIVRLRFVPPSPGQLLLRQRVLVGCLQGAGAERLTRRELDGLWRGVAEGRPHPRREPGRCGQDPVLARRVHLVLEDDPAGDRVERPQGDPVAVSVPVDRPRGDDSDALAHRHETGERLVEQERLLEPE
jgi:hypothetical protein